LARTLGISQPALSRSEAGLRQLDHDELVLAAGALRCSLEALAGEGAVAVRRHVGRGRPGRWPESQRLATIVLTDHLWSFVDQGGSATALASAAAGRAPLSAGQARIAVQVVRGASNAADPA
jgi:transcriptional regulator with XRE-family HTH domain